jgi:hypothetical protein
MLTRCRCLVLGAARCRMPRKGWETWPSDGMSPGPTDVQVDEIMMPSRIADPTRSPRLVPLCRRGTLLDSAFLSVVILSSTLLYVTRLGFYSDDWAFLSIMSTSDDRSLLGLWHQQYQFNANLQMRPTQVLYQAVLFTLFGLEPLGYHIVNALMITIMTVLVYWVLRELGLSRSVAIAVAAAYGLIPNYSTDRFWFAAFGYTLTMAFYLLSLYADLRAARSRSQSLLWWKLIALLGLLAASLGYEVVLPLLLLNVVLTWWHARRLHAAGLSGRLGRWGAILFLGSNIFMIAALLVYKSVTAQGVGLPPDETAFYAVRLVVGAVVVNYGTYGLGLPYALIWGARNASGLILVSGLGLALLVLGYLNLVARHEGGFPGRTAWRRLIAGGLVVFALGYAIFLSTGRIGFSSTGIFNRVAGLGWLCTMFQSSLVRRRCFAALIAGLCGAGFVIDNVLAVAWASAWSRERIVLEEIQESLPVLPSHGTLIVHRICPYVGPAIVYESNFDLASALRLTYGDPTLKADVVTDRLSIGQDGLKTQFYGFTSIYPYSSSLLLYDLQERRVVSLSDVQAATRYLGANDSGSSMNCTGGVPGRGALVLPTDELYLRLEARGFHP